MITEHDPTSAALKTADQKVLIDIREKGFMLNKQNKTLIMQVTSTE